MHRYYIYAGRTTDEIGHGQTLINEIKARGYLIQREQRSECSDIVTPLLSVGIDPPQLGNNTSQTFTEKCKWVWNLHFLKIHPPYIFLYPPKFKLLEITPSVEWHVQRYCSVLTLSLGHFRSSQIYTIAMTLPSLERRKQIITRAFAGHQTQHMELFHWGTKRMVDWLIGMRDHQWFFYNHLRGVNNPPSSNWVTTPPDSVYFFTLRGT